MTIAITEPTQVAAGDTLTWTKSLADYPANAGWALTYRLINGDALIDVAATASGADFLVTVTAVTSKAWAPGLYAWQAYATKAGERHTVGGGLLEVLRNLVGELAGFDARSTAEKILAGLETAFLAYTTNGQGMVARYTIEHREMWFRSGADFVKQIEYWRSQVASERAAKLIAQGLGNPRRLYARFSS